jgi:hypothetical protein
MKIQNIINENSGGAALAYNQLTPLQIGLLRKISLHKFDYENSSPQAKEAVEALVGLGLVDDVALDITDRGSAALSLADKYGSADRRKLAAVHGQQPSRADAGGFDDVEPEESMELN